MIWLASAILILTSLAAIDLFIGNRAVRALRDTSPEPDSSGKRVSIIVAARNEQRNIHEAMHSLLALDYADYELIVIDDRSEDATGSILDEMAITNPRLRIIHIDTLPTGWLGKNHAQWIGSQRASGDLLLFTDADIVMEPTVLTRAIRFMTENHIDHLAATPSIRMPTIFLGMFGTAFMVIFALFARPWKARDPGSYFHIGIGAFNLVRRCVYQSVGGHETIRLRPDDDMKLGRIIKKAGYRQDAVYAPEFLAVEWYASLGEAIRGLEKNAFAGADYNIILIVAGALFHLLCSIWPFVALLVTCGWIQALYTLTAIMILFTAADSSRFHNSPSWYAIGYPLTSTLFLFIMIRTMLLNLVQGGIHWRGTFYSLAELKKNRV